MGAKITVLNEITSQKKSSGTDIIIKYARGSLASLAVTGNTTETGTGTKSPDNPYVISGVTKVAVNGMDYMLPQTLYSLPDGVKDNCDAVIESGTQNVSLATITDSTAIYYSKYNTNTTVFYAIISDAMPSSQLICNNFSAMPITDGEYVRFNSLKYFVIQILKNRLANWSDSWTSTQKIAAFKTWLASNPVTVIYELATPVAITGTPQAIPVTAGSNAITNDGGGQMTTEYTAIFERAATTSRAFQATISKELMREYALGCTVVNTDSTRKYIVPGCVVEARGQYFDLSGYKQNSGTDNTTQISGQHVSYRLSKYSIPAGYAFVGTVQQIAQDILSQAADANGNKASSEFTVGTCVDIGAVSFSLQNTDTVTARFAIIAMKALGVEVDYDNFTLNFHTRCGTGQTKEFNFGVDLCDFSRTWDASNGATYDVKIANLQRLPGHSEDEFDVGDDCVVNDKFIGDSVQKRIIVYKYCLDDPTQDSVTLGVFIKDSADQAIATKLSAESANTLAENAQATADQAKATADNSVQQGAQYSNVSIDHTNGFMAVSADNTLKVVQNANQCFAIYARESVNDDWTLIQQLGQDGLGASSIFSVGYPDTKGTVGQTSFNALIDGSTVTYDLKGLKISISGADICALGRAINGDGATLFAPDHLFLAAVGDNGVIQLYRGRNDGASGEYVFSADDSATQVHKTFNNDTNNYGGLGLYLGYAILMRQFGSGNFGRLLLSTDYTELVRYFSDTNYGQLLQKDGWSRYGHYSSSGFTGIECEDGRLMLIVNDAERGSVQTDGIHAGGGGNEYYVNDTDGNPHLVKDGIMQP